MNSLQLHGNLQINFKNKVGKLDVTRREQNKIFCSKIKRNQKKTTNTLIT